MAKHLADEEGQSAAPNLDGTVRATPFSDEPGLWNPEPANEAKLDALDEQLAAAQLPQFVSARLL